MHPTTIAPTNTSEKLRSRPKIAAAYALMMSSDSVPASSGTSGAMRMPPSAASDEPMAHANIETRCGRAPFRVASGRSSTAARIAMPIRVA